MATNGTETDSMKNITEKFATFKTAVAGLGEVRDYLKIKNDATPELRTIASACKNLPPAQRIAVLNTLSSDNKKIVESLINIADAPTDSYAALRVAYFELVDELETFRAENGKFKRPFTRSKKSATTTEPAPAPTTE